MTKLVVGQLSLAWQTETSSLARACEKAMEALSEELGIGAGFDDEVRPKAVNRAAKKALATGNVKAESWEHYGLTTLEHAGAWLASGRTHGSDERRALTIKLKIATIAINTGAITVWKTSREGMTPESTRNDAPKAFFEWVASQARDSVWVNPPRGSKTIGFRITGEMGK